MVHAMARRTHDAPVMTKTLAELGAHVLLIILAVALKFRAHFSRRSFFRYKFSPQSTTLTPMSLDWLLCLLRAC